MIAEILFGRRERAAIVQQLGHPRAGMEWLGGSNTLAGVPVDENTAMNYAACWAATRWITASISHLPFNLYREKPGGGKEIAWSHPVQRLIYAQPNRGQSAMMFRASMLQQQINAGNCYAEIERTNGGQVVALHPVHFSRVTVKDGDDGYVYEVRNRKGGASTVDEADMFHVPSLISEDGIIGKGVVRAARESIGFGIGTERHGAAYFGNGARPNVLLKHPGKLSDNARTNLRSEWVDTHGGPDKSGKPAVLQEGMEAQILSISPEDSQFLQTRQHNVEEIARWYGVPPHKIQHLLRATFCLPASEHVFTEHGPKSISEVSVGERVWSWNGTGWVLSKVNATSQSGIDELISIHTATRTLRCNRRHRVLVRRQSLEPVSGGGGRFKIVDGKKYRKAWSVEYIPAGDVRPKDQLVAAHGLPDSGSNRTPTRNASIAFMEAMGMLLGDGYYGRSGKEKKYLSSFGISHSENPGYLPHYIEAIESEFCCASKPYELVKDRGGSAALKAKVRDKNTTVFYSMKACAELQELGMVGTAKTKRVPVWVYGMSRAHQLAFLRGYLDADGTVSKAGAVRFNSCNKNLLEDIRHLCIAAGIRCGRVSGSERASNFAGYGEVRSMLYVLCCSDVANASQIGTYTEMYKERWSAAIQKKRKRRCRVYPYEQRQNEEHDGVSYENVILIENEPIAEPVYDLDVEGTHSFVASGVVVHNSNIEHSAIEAVTDSLIPYAKLWEQEVWRKLLTPREQEQYYAKHLFDALLRGDTLSRTEALSKQFQNGALTVNQWMEIEDRNPVGPDGDVHFVPLNMTTLERAVAGEPDPVTTIDTSNQSPPVVDQEDATEDSTVGDSTEDDSTARAAVLDVFNEVVSRMVAMEADAAERAAKQPSSFLDKVEAFYGDHEERMFKALQKPLACVQAVCGACRLLDEIVAKHCAESKLAILKAAEVPASELAANVAKCVANWSERNIEPLSEVVE